MDCFQHLLKQLICYTVSKQILSKMVTSRYPICFLVLSFCIIGLQCLNLPCQGLVKSLKTITDLEQIKSILNELQNQKCLTKIIPRYKWSQNMSHIQVKVQFSASTPCSQIIFENKSVIHNEFHFRVFCLHGKLLIDYNLIVRTFKSLDFETAVWRQQEQNSFVLECLKSPAPYFWPLLHSRQIVPGRTPKVWWEMLSKYGPQLRKVIDLLQIGDVDREISKQVKRKKKPQKSKIIEFSCNQGSPEFLGSWF